MPSSSTFGQSSPSRVYSMDTGSFLLLLKRPGHEGDHTSPSSTEGENEWSLTYNLRTGAT